MRRIDENISKTKQKHAVLPNCLSVLKLKLIFYKGNDGNEKHKTFNGANFHSYNVIEF